MQHFSSYSLFLLLSLVVLSSDEYAFARRANRLAAVQPSPHAEPRPGSIPDDAYDIPPGHEEMILYRGFAHQDPGRGGWVAQFRGVLIERSSLDSRLHRAMYRAIELPFRPDNRMEERRADNRLSYFFANTLGDRYDWLYGLTVAGGERVRALPVNRDGAFETDSTLIKTDKKAGDWLDLLWQPPNTSGSRALQHGRVHLYGPTGFSIFADIDDVVKDSHVVKITELLDQTFMKTFEPVPYMPQLFQHYKKRLATSSAPDVAFHYVSSTPYSLHPSLDHFIANRTLPLGPFHLGDLRVWNPKTVVSYAKTRDFKLQEARRIVAAFPHRKLLLFGDSGQSDPEAFGILMREDPKREHYFCTFIRLISGVDAEREDEKNRRKNFEKAFRDVDPSRYYMFWDPRELFDIDFANGSCKPRGKSSTDIGTFSDDKNNDN